MTTAKELFTEKDYETLTRQQRAHILKIERAKEESGLRKVSNVLCDIAFNQIPDDIAKEMNYHELGKIAKLVMTSYLNGMEAQKYHIQRMIKA